MLTKIKDYWEREGIFTWTKGIANQFERKANTYQFREQVLRARLAANVAREIILDSRAEMRLSGKHFRGWVKTRIVAWETCRGVARESYTLPIKEYSNGRTKRKCITRVAKGLVVFS